MLVTSAFMLLTLSTYSQNTNTESFTAPLDGVVEKKLITERRVLPYAPIREADVFWEKRVWRVIDTREKINLHFRYPQRMLFDILVDEIENGNLRAYHINDKDDFSEPMTEKDMDGVLYTRDTIPVYDPITLLPSNTVVEDKINSEDIFRFRIKEVWYFDENTSAMKVRILGIAPLREVYDEFNNFLYELPLFWVYYPHARKSFARERAFNIGNDNGPMNWMDIFEMRQFASYIYKESNIKDRRIQDYLSGVDLLMESKKINEQIFNFEHDLWEF